MEEDELLGSLKEQMGFLRGYCVAYDNGDQSWAKKIALTVRILFHGSDSLYSQLGCKKDILMHDTTITDLKGNKLSYIGLVERHLSSVGGYRAPLDKGEPTTYGKKKIPFDEWWLMPVVDDKHGLTLTRSELIRSMCNKDGGAHIDLSGAKDYRALKENPGWRLTINNKVINGWELASVRQIGYEVEKSIIEDNPELFGKLSVTVNKKKTPPGDGVIIGGIQFTQM